MPAKIGVLSRGAKCSATLIKLHTGEETVGFDIGLFRGIVLLGTQNQGSLKQVSELLGE